MSSVIVGALPPSPLSVKRWRRNKITTPLAQAWDSRSRFGPLVVQRRSGAQTLPLPPEGAYETQSVARSMLDMAHSVPEHMKHAQNGLHYQLLHPSPYNKNKQQARNKQRQAHHMINCFAVPAPAPGPVVKLWGWPYPMVASLKPGVELQAAPPLRAAVAPNGGQPPTTEPQHSQTRQKRPLATPGGTSVRVCDAS